MLDDYFPCHQNNRLIFSRAIRKQLWVILIEKAMAKLIGSYEALEIAHSDEVVNALTGYPCTWFKFKYYKRESNFQEILWFRLSDKQTRGFHCSAFSVNQDSYHLTHYNSGIRPSHAYTILDVKEYNKKRLILLRDPWGENEWSGEWNLNSPRWTPELKRAFGLPELGKRKYSDKGLFWMSCNDFAHFFSQIIVCNTKQNFIEQQFAASFLPDGSRNNLTAFILKIYKQTQVYITIFDKSFKERHHPEIIYIIYSLKNNFIHKLASVSKMMSSTFICEEMCLETGEYLIIPILIYKLCTFDDTKFMFNFNVKCNHQFELKGKTDFDQLFLVDSLIEICRKRGVKYTDRNSTDKTFSYYFLRNLFNGTLIVAENLSKTTYNSIKVNFFSKEKFVSSRRAFITFDFVPPNSRQIIFLAEIADKFSENRAFSFNAYFGKIHSDPRRLGYKLNYPELDDKNKILHSPRFISNI